MRSHKGNEKGMTLVEILAALVILGIVFIGFMTVFPQMTSFNEKTEDKLVTMNLAKKELANIVENPQYLLTKISSKIEVSSDVFVKRYKYDDDSKKYTYEVDFYEKPELGDEKETDVVSINKIHVKVFKIDKLSSETFGYFKN